jgi:hypothetical protein
LEPALQKAVHVALLSKAVAALERAYPPGGQTVYFENLCGTQQYLDHALPRDALEAVERGEDHEDVRERYLEPLAALQEESLRLTDSLDYGYYAIYNAFRLHVLHETVDPWLIANQALSVLPENQMREVLANAVSAASSRLAG